MKNKTKNYNKKIKNTIDKLSYFKKLLEKNQTKKTSNKYVKTDMTYEEFSKKMADESEQFIKEFGTEITFGYVENSPENSFEFEPDNYYFDTQNDLSIDGFPSEMR